VRRAGATRRNRGEQRLVVVEAETDRRRGHVFAATRRGQRLQLVVLDEADVRMSVAEQQECCAAAVCGSPGLLEPA
jgi:hypothetical protein